MEIEVYVDLLFLINAAMDGLCLCLTARLLHRRISRWRVLAAAVLGGGYAVASLFWETGRGTAILLDLLVCLLLCAVAFGSPFAKGGRFPRRFPQMTLLYLLLSLILGGIMTALFSLFNRLGLTEALEGLFGGEDGSGDGAEPWLFGLVALVGSILTLWGGRFLRGGRVSEVCRVKVTLGGRQVTLEGMTDTGNLLRDPLSGRAVICADEGAIGSILSHDLAHYLSGKGDPAPLSEDSARRVRVIPARTAAGDSLLYGFLPDGVLLDSGSGNMAVEAVIAVTRLSGVDALVPAELCK